MLMGMSSLIYVGEQSIDIDMMNCGSHCCFSFSFMLLIWFGRSFLPMHHFLDSVPGVLDIALYDRVVVEA